MKRSDAKIDVLGNALFLHKSIYAFALIAMVFISSFGVAQEFLKLPTYDKSRQYHGVITLERSELPFQWSGLPIHSSGVVQYDPETLDFEYFLEERVVSSGIISFVTTFNMESLFGISCEIMFETIVNREDKSVSLSLNEENVWKAIAACETDFPRKDIPLFIDDIKMIFAVKEDRVGRDRLAVMQTPLRRGATFEEHYDDGSFVKSTYFGQENDSHYFHVTLFNPRSTKAPKEFSSAYRPEFIFVNHDTLGPTVNNIVLAFSEGGELKSHYREESKQTFSYYFIKDSQSIYRSDENFFAALDLTWDSLTKVSP